jgi:hypothetical protein
MTFEDYELGNNRGECMGNFTMEDVALYATYVFSYNTYNDGEGLRPRDVRIIQVLYRGNDMVHIINDNDVWTSAEETILRDLEEVGV